MPSLGIIHLVQILFNAYEKEKNVVIHNDVSKQLTHAIGGNINQSHALKMT
jgi:hypothetical protein